MVPFLAGELFSGQSLFHQIGMSHEHCSDALFDSSSSVIFRDVYRDAAALACVCVAAAAAAPTSRWRSAVRIGPGGHVLEPASGTFDVTVAPGEGVQAAVDRCPPGGCVLLLPGTHEGRLALTADKEVHVFGRGRATLKNASGLAVVISDAGTSTLDGLVIRREKGGLFDYGSGVIIEGGTLRMQACDVTSASYHCVKIEGGADPVLVACKCVLERSPLRCLFLSRMQTRGGRKGPPPGRRVGRALSFGVRLGCVSCPHPCPKPMPLKSPSLLRFAALLHKIRLQCPPPPHLSCRDGAALISRQCPPPTHPSFCDGPRRIYDGRHYGVYIRGIGTKGRLEGCEVTRNDFSGVSICEFADPLLSLCQ